MLTLVFLLCNHLFPVRMEEMTVLSAYSFPVSNTHAALRGGLDEGDPPQSVGLPKEGFDNPRRKPVSQKGFATSTLPLCVFFFLFWEIPACTMISLCLSFFFFLMFVNAFCSPELNA